MDYIYTFLWSMTPFGELRISIPLGIETYDLPWYGVFPVAVIGNLVPALFWLFALPRIGNFLIRFSNPIGRLLAWRVERLRKSNLDRVQRIGPMALVVIVAIPLPLTGVWTGCLAAWALEIPFWRALPPIALGALIAGVIVTSLTVVGLEIAKI